jgi:ribosomal protein S18 acetylase RimI-like enzyme
MAVGRRREDAPSAHYRHTAVKVRRHPAGLGHRVRVRPWAHDERVVHLSLADQAIVPRSDELERWIDTLVDTTPDLRQIRTGALFPAAAARFADAGFVAIDTLALLRIDLDRAPGAIAGSASTSRLRVRHHPQAALVDRLAFGDPWACDARDLAEIRQATPLHRASARFERDGPSRRRLFGFAISGAASGHGYLQRLAVHPGQQRRGHGRTLVVDALTWMRRRHLTHGVVNTAVANTPALALYDSVGFRRLPEQLLVMQLDVADVR